MIVEGGWEVSAVCAMQATGGLEISVERNVGSVVYCVSVAEMEIEVVEERMEVDVNEDVDVEMGDATEEEDVEMTDGAVQEDIEMKV